MMVADGHGDMTYDDEGRQQQLELQQSDQEDHDQLPNVEEYKAVIGHRSRSSAGFKSKVFKAIGNLGPSSAGGIEEESEFVLPPDGTRRRLDPPEHINQKYEIVDYEEERAVENEGLFRDDGDDGDMHEFEEEETMDSEEEEKRGGNPNNCFWRSCCCVTLCLVVSVLVQFFAFGFGTEEEMEPRDFFHFVVGDTDAYFAVRDYAVNIANVSDSLAFGATSTPQYLASQWMAHGDPMNMPVPEKKDLQYSERYIMAVLFFSLRGTEWTHRYNFLSGDHICTWFQEFNLADESTVLYGIHRCEEDGGLYPTTVFLPNNNLSGFIPDEVAGLERLEEFNVMFNPNVVGTIPAALSRMASLKHLGLQWCNFDGPIPRWLGDMTNLVFLGLGNNLLDSTVPSELSKLTRLELLGLDDNDLFGDIGTFAPLSNLRSLYLENNFINGTISEGLLRGWPELEELDLSECGLSGSLPATLFDQNPELAVLDLHGNQFDGPFPGETTKTNTALDFLAVHNNRLSGFIPGSLTNLRALRHLDLSDNLFSGTIPQSIGEMTTLDYLFTGTNNFLEGEIPIFLIELTNLRELSMKQNKLKGTIPEFFLYLSNLVFLDLHDNDLSRTIPTGFGKLTALRHLILKKNSLSGPIPNQMRQMTALQILLMEQNRFDGNADPICGETSFSVQTFVADCGTGGAVGSPPPSAKIPGISPTTATPPTTTPPPSRGSSRRPIAPPTTAALPTTTAPSASPWIAPPTGGGAANRVPSVSTTTSNPTAGSTFLDEDDGGTSPPSAGPPNYDDDPVSKYPSIGAGSEGGSGSGGSGGGGQRNQQVDDLAGDGGVRGRRRLQSSSSSGRFGCSCCSICCDPGDDQCNNWDWKGNLDPIWEHGHKRKRYTYDLGPVVWAP